MRRSLMIIVAGLSTLACASRTTHPASETIDVVVLSTTDVHGRVRGWDYHTDEADPARGLARVATVVDSVRGVAPDRVIVVDAGDLLQGNPLAYVAARVAPRQPHPVIAAMNAIGYDAAAIGNHEFNFGLEFLDEAIEQAQFAFLAANAFRPDGRRAYAPWHIVRRGPVRIGIVGATTPGSMVWDRQHLEGRLILRDIVESVRGATAEVKSAGADVVIAVLHAGLDGPATYDSASRALPGENVAARLAAEVPGLALVVYGHSHRELADTVIAGTRLIQPLYWATSVGVATLRLERQGGRWRVVSSTGAVIPVRGRNEHRSVLAATDAAHRETRSYVSTTIGSTPVAWRSDSGRVANTAIVDFMLEVLRRAAGTDLAAGPAYTVTAGLGPGTINVADLTRLYPYENTLRAIRIDGRQLREYLEFSSRHFGTWGTDEPVITPGVPGFNFDIVKGVEYALDLSRPVGARVVSLTRRGRPVADTDTFTMALSNYRQSGGGSFTMIANAPLVLEGDTEMRQLLIDEVRRRGVIRPEEYESPSWRLVPAEAAQRAYRVMHATRRDGGPPADSGAPSPAPARATPRPAPAMEERP